MVTVYAALYPEAAFLIEEYALKKTETIGKIQIFSNQQLRVVITGVGSIAAATAVGVVCGKYPVGRQDVLLNLGSCAAVHPGAVGEWFRIHKITELATGRTFYPDLLKKHPFMEAEILTGSKVCSKKDLEELYRNGKAQIQNDSGVCSKKDLEELYQNHTSPWLLYDMEAAAIYQAGSYFYAPDRMIFLKMVSDCGVEEIFSGAQLKERMADRAGHVKEFQKESWTVKGFLQQLLESSGENEVSKMATAGEKLVTDLCCSVTMKEALQQLLKYCELAGRDWQSVIQGYYQNGLLPCDSKREGKRIYEEIRRRLL